MSERRVDSTCHTCENNCDVTMSVDDVGIVTSAWRIVPVLHGFEQKECQQLNVIVGKNIDKALRRVQAPALGTFLAGGH